MEQAARSEIAGLLLRGVPREELEQVMLRVFRKADADGSGHLSRSEFKRCLRAAEMGLTRKDINLLLGRVDANHDGLVSYEEFVPICFQVGFNGCVARKRVLAHVG
jgi:Ca2+-binding EF-hand superfamily protein